MKKLILILCIQSLSAMEAEENPLQKLVSKLHYHYTNSEYQEALLSNTSDNSFQKLPLTLQNIFKTKLQEFPCRELNHYHVIKKFDKDGPLSIEHIKFCPTNKQLLLMALNESYRNGKGYLQLWDLENDKELYTTQKYNTQHINSINFSPTGKEIVTALKGSAPIYDTNNGNLLGKIERENHTITKAAFSLDNKQLFIIIDQQKLEVLDNEILHELHIAPLLKTLPASVKEAEYLPDGQTLATINEKDHTLRLWNIRDWTLKRVVEVDTIIWPHIKFSPSNALVAVLSNGCYLQLWNYETGKSVPEPVHRSYRTRSIAFSPDNNELVFGEDDGILKIRRLDDTEWEKDKALYKGAPIISIDYASPDIMACADGRAYILKKLPQLKEYILDPTISLGSLFFLDAFCHHLGCYEKVKFAENNPFFKEFPPDFQQFLKEIATRKTILI
jgi:WD40 repeat protein